MKQAIFTEKAPGAIGPYSQAIKVGNMVYTSGQIPLDPLTGEMPEGIKAQTEQVLRNMKNVLEAAGTTMDQVVKTTVFLADMSLFPAMNEVYASFFTGVFPARSAVAVREIPKGALVEIEVVALISDEGPV